MAPKPKKSRGSSSRKGQAKENETDVEANVFLAQRDSFSFQNVPVYRTVILINLCFWNKMEETGDFVHQKLDNS